MATNSHGQCFLPEKMQRCQDYMQALEEERSKIQVFQRELPLCLELVTQAIESCKQQLSGTTTECNLNGQSESSEETSSDLPVLEEFIPMKRASSDSDCEEQEPKKPKIDVCPIDGKNGGDKNIKKSDWLRSVQLWNQNPDPTFNEDSPRNVEVKRDGSGGAFHPFKKDKAASTSNGPPAKSPVLPAATSSTVGTGSSGGGGNKKEEKEGQCRKARRCWSNELHQKFLQALHQLGGSHLATPKQIRELMKVDGLTNDEVKSHLQKYRLHIRRPTPSVQNAATTTPAATQAPQFVVVAGGLWMPPEYTAAMPAEVAGGAASTGIYAPVAILPRPFQATSGDAKKGQHENTTNLDDLGSRNEQHGIRAESPAASSSMHTKSK